MWRRAFVLEINVNWMNSWNFSFDSMSFYYNIAEVARRDDLLMLYMFANLTRSLKKYFISQFCIIYKIDVEETLIVFILSNLKT